ncbi:MAG: NADPH:quinone oxidoreductase family protein [Acidimicrobiales bacterium]
MVCRQVGALDGLTVEEGSEPVPGPGQVVVSVEAAGVNYVDALFVQGRYQIKPPVPFTPGSEIAGTVALVGDGVEGWRAGDRVMAMTGLGGYAERVVVPATSLVEVPEGVALPAAAAFIQSYCTALFALTRRTRLDPGEHALVLGAGGGVGLASIDVATALGARAIGAASTPDKQRAARSMGAVEVVDYTTEDLKTRVRELTGRGADVVIDPVGGPHAEPALRSLRSLGRYLVIGFAAGPIPSLPLNQILLNNRTVVGVDWGSWALHNPADQRSLLGELVELVLGGRLHPPAPDARPLDRVVGALEDLLGRRVTGKLVLVP